MPSGAPATSPQAPAVALKELELLQGIITRYETQEFQVRTWCLALLGALVAALFSEKARLVWWIFGLVSLLLLCLFGLMELVIRIPKRKAIARVSSIEEALRAFSTTETMPYAFSPQISRSLGSDWTWRHIYPEAKAEIRLLPFHGFYIPAVAVALILTGTAYYNASHPPGGGELAAPPAAGNDESRSTPDAGSEELQELTIND